MYIVCTRSVETMYTAFILFLLRYARACVRQRKVSNAHPLNRHASLQGPLGGGFLLSCAPFRKRQLRYTSEPSLQDRGFAVPFRRDEGDRLHQTVSFHAKCSEEGFSFAVEPQVSHMRQDKKGSSSVVLLFGQFFP